MLGVALSGFVTFAMGLNLLWSGALQPHADGGSKPWWLWVLFPTPAVLMAMAGILARRFGASVPIALGVAGMAGVAAGVTLLVLTQLQGR